MIGWVYLIACVAVSAAIWPVARWALKGDGQVRVMGFWTCVVTAGVNLCAAWWQGVTPWQSGFGDVWTAAGLFSVAYAVGFYILVMRCLQTGPAGPTVTVNNSAMICGVLYGLLWVNPNGLSNLNILVVVGALGTLLAMTLVGIGKSPAQDSQIGGPRDVTARWKFYLLLGGAFSGLSFATQSYIGETYPGQPRMGQLYGAIGFALAGVILLATQWRRPGQLLRRREIIGGAVVGVLNAAGSPVMMNAFAYFGSEVVFPVAVVSPMAITLVIGHWAYRERLARVVWAGCILAAISVGIIAYGSNRPASNHPLPRAPLMSATAPAR